MEKKNATSPGGEESKAARKESNQPITNPDTSVLEHYSPTGGAESHPDWIKKKFPTYIMPHGQQEATSARELTHNGHNVKIITTYRVEVDGKPANMNLSVDEDGRVFTHATPFVTYASAVDLMKEVMDAYPDAFSDSDSDAGHDHDNNHNHGGGHT